MKFQLTATQISLVAGVIIPAIVALATKQLASGRVKQLTLLALSVVGGWFAAATSTTQYDLKTVLVSIGTTFVAGAAAYFGFNQVVYDPIRDATPNTGIGSLPSSPPNE